MKLITVIILTKDEQKHIARCIESLQALDANVFVIDSFSGDETVAIAESLGATVLQNKFVNHAVQFQWALDNCNIHTPWVMRMDADEYLLPELAREIQERLPKLDADINGVIMKRRLYFMNRWIRFGGYYPVKLLRLWRSGHAYIEQKWMDEHMVLTSGKTIEFAHDFVDENMNSLSWWTTKHNAYSTREAIDILNGKYGLFESRELDAEVTSKDVTSRKRWLKSNLYLRMPPLFRAFLYFHFRYFIQLGILDGWKGLIWHFLQGFWYRFLVDAKVLQIERMAKQSGRSIPDIIESEFDFRIRKE